MNYRDTIQIPSNSFVSFTGKMLVNQMRLWKDQARRFNPGSEQRHRAMVIYHLYAEELHSRLEKITARLENK
jgi:hypothetical protein